jgi:RND family efflux transporter MFP subunit
MTRSASLPMLLIALCAAELRAAAGDSFTEPNRLINIAAAETGIVTQIEVHEGDHVRNGQLLATLDLEILEASLAVARARMQATGPLLAARAEHELWKTKVQKLRLLRAEGHLSVSEMERAEADLAVARARLVAAEEEQRIAALECKKIEAQIQRRRIRSPIDGVIVKVRKEQGEALMLSDPTILTLAELDQLRIRFSMTYAQASQFRVGQTVRVSLPETGQRAEARVEVIAPVSDAKSGTVPVTLVLNNHDGRYRSGLRCVLEVPAARSLAGGQ